MIVKKFDNLIVLVLLAVSCSNNEEIAKINEDKSFVGIPFIPENVAWERLDSSNKFEDLYSNFKTFYFANDSAVFVFSGLNNKKLICIDTTILDKKSNVYNDTVFCNYEDSVALGVENLQMLRGKFSINKNKIILKFGRVGGDKTFGVQGNPSEIADTLGIDESDHIASFVFENKKFVPTQRFKTTSMKKLLRLASSKF